ncbi:hypothetical protein L873DRAFT_1810472 [Choiromyces venosus 120613-1]|uniref:Uncharacterized protein n=1 Tax=Choiromyces venosus 120613-1 TaxID=1336337 RepID=A0A3N4JJR0_9PEZI|nr:hypothetical protein L873DRAFT_1810472 [Choiromyces venosus 120613-1]
MFKLLIKPAFKPMGIYHHLLQVHHLYVVIGATPRCNTNTDSASHLAGSAGGKSLPNMAPDTTWQCFRELEKTTTATHTGLCHLQAGQKEWVLQIDNRFNMMERQFAEAHSKMYHLLYLILGSVSIKAVLSLYLKEDAQRESDERVDCSMKESAWKVNYSEKK